MQLNESRDINIPDCTSIDVSHLEALRFRMDLYDTIKDTYDTIQENVHGIVSYRVNYCSWINNRIPGNCTHDYRATLNEGLCTNEKLKKDCNRNDAHVELCVVNS